MQETVTDANFIVRAINSHDALVASCKELKEALAAAMRAMEVAGVSVDGIATFDLFNAERKRLGIPDGIGVRAQAAISKAAATQE